MKLRVAIAMLLLAGAAHAQAQPPAPPAPTEKPPEKPANAPVLKGPDLTRYKLNGYFVPFVLLSDREAAVPRDRVTLGMVSSRVGLVLTGQPYEMWSYKLEVGFDAAVLNNQTGAVRTVSSVDAIDPSGSGQLTGLSVQYQFLTAVPVEEASVTFAPADWYNVKVGRMRAPFSVGHGATITAQMFPARPGPTAVFMNGADEGILNNFQFLDDRVQIKAGAFNGSSLGLQLPNTTSIGPVFSVFSDVAPFGKMPAIESDSGRGPFRAALGLGTLYRIGTTFDATGYEATRFRDLRLSSALRIAFRGLFLQGEYLRRLQTDDLSLRPAVAHGEYAQGAFYIPLVDTYAIAPIARYGVSVQDESFAITKIFSYEGGLIFYPRADLAEPDSIRITLQYIGERREPATETANGAIAHFLFKW
ncbi:MAG TPA: hypothetical protein VIF62_03025 [Labilithrix sp.]|jgi:hypothetical protein